MMMAGDDLVRKSDEQYRRLLSDVAGIQTQMLDLLRASHRTERYLVGGWNEDGTQYIAGVRDTMDAFDRRVGDAVKVADEANKRFTVFAAGVWGVFVILIPIAANALIDLWKASHGAVHP